MSYVTTMERKLLKYLDPKERSVEDKVKILYRVRITREIPIARLARDYSWDRDSVYIFLVRCIDEQMVKGDVPSPDGEFRRWQDIEPIKVSDTQTKQTEGDRTSARHTSLGSLVNLWERPDSKKKEVSPDSPPL